MGKTFAPRLSKKQRKTVTLSQERTSSLFKLTDERLLKGARLSEIYLKDIRVKEQVRTKFNDASLKELADNIRVNGLIQPLVLHLKGDIHTLICGERRFRAMSLIEMEKCPCFVLQDKTEEELIAIQFSENSSREALHYVDKADGIYHYRATTGASEREITAALGISKSEVHRSLMIARLPKKIKEAAKIHDIEKYVLLEFHALERGTLRKQIEGHIVGGRIQKRGQLRRLLSEQKVTRPKRKKATPALPAGVSANLFLKAMKSKAKEMDMDEATRRQLDTILTETRDLIDL